MITLTRRATLTLPAAAALAPRRGRAQEPGLRVGVLTDMSGTYRDAAGPLGVAATRQAVAESGMAVEVLAADHQNKADVAASIARTWFDRDGVDMIVDGTNSACGLAIAGVAREKNKVHVNSGTATSAMTGAQCNPNTVHWTYDTYMLARSTGGALVAAGGTSWFFITADYTFGHTLETDCTGFITGAGGKVLGSVSYPFPATTDFSSLLLQAASSGAKVIGLAAAGTDLTNLVKQAREFGVTRGGARLAGLLVFISDVHALGLETAQGLVITNSFYWDHDERTRAFSARLLQHAPEVRPGMIQAGDYAGTLHYLKAARAMGVAQARRDGAAAVAQMKRMPTDDDAFGPGSIRPDGRALHPSFLWQVKTPAESSGPWDCLKLLATTPADQAFRPISRGGCPLAT